MNSRVQSAREDKEIAGCRLESLIYESSRTLVYRAIRHQDGRRVVVKTLNQEYPSSKTLARLQHEYRVLRHLRSSGTVHAYGLEKHTNNLALILEDCEALPLSALIQTSQSVSMDLFFAIATQLARIVGEVHGAHIIHKDISPDNVLWRPQREELKLIDFDSASQLTSERVEVESANRRGGSLAYIAPEQTGRMNRKVDYRADFYSLGITLYELLTGQTPFLAEDNAAWIYCHIARTPPTPESINTAIPTALSRVLLKLIAKNAEDRYQSAHGLLHDLKECRAQWERTGGIEDFTLARQDVPETFHIPQKLYGREGEVARLLKTFDNVSRGHKAFMLVAGYSGVGKSTLIREIHKPIVHRRGYFCEGKFDQFQRHIPYSAIAQAFRGLVRQLLSEPEERLAQWRTELRQALGGNAQIIVDLIPEVETIIGPRVPVQELNAAETQNRLHITFQNFVNVFAKSKHPLVLFLDDLHWSDAPTLRLVHHLMTANEVRSLLLLGAYRDNEVNDGHRLIRTLAKVEESRPVETLFLEPLGRPTVHRICAETLRRDLDYSRPLSDAVFEKTGGNPFFVNELLKNLHEEEVIAFLHKEGRWHWDRKKLDRVAVSENVVELIINNLKRCSENTLKILRFASCIGNQFDLKTLSQVADQNPSTTRSALRQGMRQGIIIPLNDEYSSIGEEDPSSDDGAHLNPSYRFQHDRVQQAVSSLIAAHEKKEIHLSVGRSILKHGTPEERDLNLIDIVGHLNEGRLLIREESEQLELAQLNLEAAQKAKMSAAYQTALQLFATGKELLGKSAWGQAYQLTFDLHHGYSECAYICGEFDEAERTSAILIDRSATNLEKAEIYHMQSVQYATSSELDKSIDAGLKGLSLLGLTLPKQPADSMIGEEMARAETNLGSRQVADLLQAPMIKEAREAMIMVLLPDVTHAAYVTGNKNLLLISVLKAVNVSLRHGTVSASAFVFNMYGFFLGTFFGDFATGYEFGKVAIALNERFNDMSRKASTLFTYVTFVHSWNNHPRTYAEYYKRVIEAGLESGDLIFLAYSCINILSWDPEIDLPTAVEEGSRYLKIIEGTNYQNAVDMAQISQHLRLSLRGRTNGRCSLSSTAFDEDESLLRFKEGSYYTGVAFYHVYKLQAHYFYEDYEGALSQVAQGDGVIETLSGQAHTIEYCLYAFLTLAASYARMDPDAQEEAERRLRQELGQMETWSNHNPTTFLHFRLLMEAETARLWGDPSRAAELYDEAIDTANQNGFLRYEALANELAAKFHLEQAREKLSGNYMREAQYLYSRWGATAKVQHLEETYGRFFSDLTPREKRVGEEPAAPMASSLELDLDTIIKASQALVSEINLDELLKKIMQRVMENAGADKGLLILQTEEKWYIEAACGVDGTDMQVLQSIPIAGSPRPMLPGSVVFYTIRTQENVVLNNVEQDDRFANDAYIREAKPKSVLCVPLMTQGQLRGLLYLENHLTTGAFTPDRLQLLTLLSSQAAIAIENARLYRDSQASEEKYRALFEESKDLIFISTLDGQIEDVNHASMSLVGYTPEEARQFNALEFYADPRDRTHMKETLLEQGSVKDYAVKFRHKDGREIDVSVTATLRRMSDGTVLGFQGIVRDTTEQKRAEEERLRVVSLEKEKEAAETASKAKTTFLANMSHELRTPLNAILGFTGLMGRDPTLPEEHKENLGIIHRAGEHLLDLIKDVLEMSKIEAGQSPLLESDFDLHLTLKRLEEMFVLPAKRRGLALVIESETGLPRFIHTDERKLSQVLINLIGNAIKFTEKGSVILRAGIQKQDRQHEQARSERDDPIPVTLHFEIEDSGPGICRDEIDSLFEPFARTEREFGGEEGAGLGLPISRRLVQLMGGELTVVSQVGEGTTCRFDIRAGQLGMEVLERPRPARRAIALSPNQPPRRIAVVDDNSDSRSLLRKLLEGVGFAVEVAANGEQAVALHERWRPNLVWMDMRMPVMDGYEATRQIKASKPKTVVLALTADAFDEGRDAVLAAGCDDLLCKPIRIEDILAKTAEHLGVRYVYEERAPLSEADTPGADHVPSPAALKGLSSDWIEDLRRAASEGESKQALDIIEKIQTDRPTLALSLSAWVRQFQFGRIVDLVEASAASKTRPTTSKEILEAERGGRSSR